jgi:NADPH:quinone reductase-like Zn-dependent oxidoreductase
MRAFRYHATSRGTTPKLEDVPVPEPAAGEVLVRVECASLNPVDWKIATGHLRFLVKGGLPRTMGSDFAGAIAATGPGVSGWAPGDPVMGFVDPFKRPAGTFAEYVTVLASFLMRRPPPVDAVTGAALPCVGITAIALCEFAHVGRGSSVLVNGASGGVGHLAVQVAKARGALVAAAASAGRREFVASLGADEFIDYRARPLADWPMAFDAVLDCVPNLPRRSHLRLLQRGGHYASTLPNGWTYTLDPLLNRWGRLQRHAVMLQPDGRATAELLHCLEAGTLRCEVAGVFPLEETARAIEQSQSGHVAGKLVIRVA